MRRKKTVRLMLWVPLLAVLFVFLCLPACPHARHTVSRVAAKRSSDKPHGPNDFLVTAYCSCGICCGWRPRYWFVGSPVFTSGPHRGQPKEVGRTASGRIASRGTVAADLKVFPFGTQLEIPGYGIGRVEDTGGSIRGRHIDVWFPTHREALAWGARWLPIRRLR